MNVMRGRCSWLGKCGAYSYNNFTCPTGKGKMIKKWGNRSDKNPTGKGKMVKKWGNRSDKNPTEKEK